MALSTAASPGRQLRGEKQPVAELAGDRDRFFVAVERGEELATLGGSQPERGEGPVRPPAVADGLSRHQGILEKWLDLSTGVGTWPLEEQADRDREEGVRGALAIAERASEIERLPTRLPPREKSRTVWR